MSMARLLKSGSPFGRRLIAIGMLAGLVAAGLGTASGADRTPSFPRPPVPVLVINDSGERCRISVNGWAIGELPAGRRTVLLVPIGNIRMHARLLTTERDWYLAVREFRPFGWRIAPPRLPPQPPQPPLPPTPPVPGVDEVEPPAEETPAKAILAYGQSRKVWGGITIEAPSGVGKPAVDEAERWVQRMLLECPRVRKAIVDAGLRVCVYPVGSELTDLPNTAWLRGKQSRGGYRYEDVAGIQFRSTCVVPESNLLGPAGAGYPRSNVLVHEISHAIERFAFDDTERGRLEQAWKLASERSLWEGAYAGRNAKEYWAELVCCWFGLSNPSLTRNVNGPYQLKQYDRQGYELVRDVFTGNRKTPSGADAGNKPRTVHRLRRTRATFTRPAVDCVRPPWPASEFPGVSIHDNSLGQIFQPASR